MPKRRGIRHLLLAAAAASLLISGLTESRSQPGWPSQPITVIVPFAAGGGNDALVRLIAPTMSEVLKQQLVIVNVPGAGGMVGAARVAKAAPDGYTLGVGTIGNMAISQTLHKTPPYNSVTDFAHVSMIADQPSLLVTRKDLPATDLKSFIAHARANQSAMNYGSAGVGSSTHLGCALLNMAMGVTITHVPYRGGPPAMADMIAGRLDYWCPFSTTALSPIKSDTVRALAVLAPERLGVLPNLPTAREQGLTNVDSATWNALFAPAGTATPIIEKLKDAVMAALEAEPVRKRLHELGMSIAPKEHRTPEFVQSFVKSEIQKWAGPIKAVGLGGQ